MQDDSARAWDRIARQEPYFAVLTHDRFLSRNMTAATQAEFYATGEAWVAHVLAVIRRLAPAFEPHSVLEFGCGPGRLAIPFAKKLGRVVAADASPEMLRLVAEAAARFATGNVEMASAEAVLDGGEQFDLVSAHGLLQHLAPDDGLALLRRLLTLVTDGGFAVLHVPFRMNAGGMSAITRRLRAAVPLLNWIANALRHRPAAIPLFTPHAQDLGGVASILATAGFEAPHVEFVREGELDVAQMFVRKRAQCVDDDVEIAASTGGPAGQPRLIDVKQLIAETSIEELNIAADAYFSSLTDWEHHLAKPFASVEDASHILTHVGPLLGGLRLAPGHTVLEFGAGTGWLSHALTQMGCKAVLLDVSPAALQIARELYARQPVIGRKPEPEFLAFDGRRIGLPDASVDRVICFDAFHHAPNPDEVIGDLARVLRPGGIAGFSEPGPQHSKTPQSQFEMRTYRVVENDVHIREIWSAARVAGFDRIELAAVAGPPLLLSLADFEDLVGRGDATRWTEFARDHLSNVRMFFLHRAGEERADSRRRAGLAVSIDARALRPPLAGEPAVIEATLTNGGTSCWLPGSAVPGGVSLGIHVYSARGEMIDFEFHREPIPREVAPGESIGLRLETRPVPPGAARLELDCVAEGVTWFAQIGATPVTIEIAQ